MIHTGSKAVKTMIYDINLFDDELEVSKDGLDIDQLEDELNKDLSSKDRKEQNSFYNDDEGNRILGVYFKNISNISLLNSVQEKRIAAKIKVSLKILEKLDKSESSNANEIKKNLYLKQVNSLKQTFVSANLRLVIKIAKNHTDQGLPMSDLIQEGNLGLIRAVEKFDHLKGFKFSTYAAWWINQFMARGVMLKTKTVKTPAYVLERKNIVFRAKYALKEELGVEPNENQIAEKSGMTKFLVKKILEGTDNIYSLDRPIKYDESGANSFLDLMSDDNLLKQDDAINQKSMKKLIIESLKFLDVRELEVLKLRYGLLNEQNHTLDQIGQKYGVSRERVRQIEKEALIKLATSENAEVLKNFLN